MAQSLTIETYPNWVNLGQWINQGLEKAAYRPSGSIDGRKTILYQKRRDLDPNTIIGRGGIVALGNPSSELVTNKTFLWVTGSTIMSVIGGSGWSSGSGTFAQGEYCAQALGMGPNGLGYGFEGYEFAQEGPLTDHDPPICLYDDHPFAQGFYTKRRQMYANAGRSYPTSGGNYGSFDMYNRVMNTGFRVDGTPVSPTHSHFKDYYIDKDHARTCCTYLMAGRDSIYDANVRYYPTNFDYARDFYTVLHAMEVMKKGSNGKVYLHIWPLIEQVSRDDNGHHTLHNNHNYERQLLSPRGRYITGEHPMIDFDFNVAVNLFAGYMDGDGVLGWDNPQLFSTDVNKVTPPNPHPTPDRAAYSEWFPEIAGTPAPVGGTSGMSDNERIAYGYPELPLTHQDAILVAEHLKDTMKQTAGQPFEHIPYTVTAQAFGFGATFTPVNISRSVQFDGSTLLHDAAANDSYWDPSGRRGRGVLKGRIKRAGGTTYFSAAYFDPSLTKSQRERITPVIDGYSVGEITVQGGKVTVFNGQL